MSSSSSLHDSEPSTPQLSLPADIVRLILEIAFTQASFNKQHQPSRLDLLLLSKDTKAWLDPLLYQDIDRFKFRAQLPDVVRHSVRSIIMPSSAGLAHTLSTCPNLWQLAMWTFTSWSDIRNEQLSELSHPHLRRLCLFIEDVPSASFSFKQGLFRSLTHLRLVIEFEETPRDVFRDLKDLPHLTHLCYTLVQTVVTYSPRVAFKDLCYAALRVVPPLKLQVVILVAEGWSDVSSIAPWPFANLQSTFELVVAHDLKPDVLEEEAPIHELLVRGFVLPRKPARRDWALHDGPDLWELADEALSKRRGFVALSSGQ